MTNPFFNNVQSLTPGTIARAGDVEAKFDAVGVGFDGVETAKAGTNSPTFTGVPAAPTAPLGTNTTQLATTAFVISQLATGTTPAGPADANKYWFWDGSVYSWKAAAANITIQSRSPGNTPPLVGADLGFWIQATGSFTQTFGTRAAGWWCIYSNMGTGDITITTDFTTYLMYPGETRMIVFSGGTDYSIVLSPYRKTFTASGSWTKPPGYKGHSGAIIGGGGSGRRGAAGTIRCGGGGGAYTAFSFRTVELLFATVNFTIGAGGAAVTADNTDGNPGGNSAFDTGLWNIVSGGGLGGTNSANGVRGGVAYVGRGTGLNPTRAGANPADANDSRTDGFYGGGSSHPTAPNATTGGTVYGAGGGDSITAANARAQAAGSVFGAIGGSTNAAGTVIQPGTSLVGAVAAAGAGGAASTNGTNSGAGLDGEIRIWGEM